MLGNEGSRYANAEDKNQTDLEDVWQDTSEKNRQLCLKE